MHDLFVALGDVLIFIGAIAAWAFVLTYAVVAPFWRSEEGAHLMAFTGFIAAVLTYISVTTFTRNADPSLPVVRVVIFAPLAALMIWRLSILIRAQVRHRRDDRTLPSPPIPVVPSTLKEPR